MNKNSGPDIYLQNCITDTKTGKPACPLQNVEISAVIDNFISEVTLTQNFLNTSDDPIEAIYTFPIPHDAQVTGFSCRIGDDVIRGEFREKEEAFREYDQAVRKGDSAFLLESHRPDIFQVSLGNMAAGETASIRISYIQDIRIVDHELRWSIPTVVAPRYIPGNASGLRTGPGTAVPTDIVPDADYITPPVANTTYTLKIDAVLKGIKGLKKVSSPSHPVEISFNGGDVAVSLSKENEPLDSDFVIIAQLAEDNRDCFITAYGGKGMFGSLSFCPDLSDHIERPGACEYIFLIDVSGSMGGEKLEQAKRALSISLRNLFEGDFFNVIAFESNYRCFSNESLPYSQHTLESADKWISALTEMGGTEIYEPMRFVLEHSPAIKGLERVIFLFTDGQVGDENRITSLVRENNKSLQLYPFGIDTAVNRYFIDSLAREGNGMPEYIYPGERIEDKVIRQFSRIHQPYLENLSVTGMDGRAFEIVPPLPVRLYDSENVSFTVHSEDSGRQDTLSIHGNIGGRSMVFEIKGENTGDERLLGLKWAKGRIMELERQLSGTNQRRNELTKKEIIELSAGYSVLSTLTSLVAVYSRKTKTSGVPRTIVVPVAAPRGWTMPMAAGKAYSFAPQCVTEACMRSYPDDDGEMNSFSAVMDEPESITIPSFLKKGRSSQNRSGFGRMLRNRAETTFRSGMPQAYVGHAEVNTPENIPDRTNCGLHDMVIMAAQHQNAAGSFGTGEAGILRTSCFIIGMLLLDDEWKPYRVQLMKAGDALIGMLSHNPGISAGSQSTSGAHATLKQQPASNGLSASITASVEHSFLLASAALAMLTDSGLLRHDTKISTLENIINNLPGDAADLFNAILSGNADRLPDTDGRIPAGTADKRSRAAHYLQYAINIRQAPDRLA